MTESIDSNELDETKTYEELSAEFRTTFSRAYKLIPIMYTRLTSVDKMSHNSALEKIYEDHKDLPGFSGRNIRRYLPSDNPVVPRRIRPRRPKSRANETEEQRKLSSAKSVEDKSLTRGIIECQSCLILQKKNEELEEALEADTKFTPDNLNNSVKEFRFSLKFVDVKTYLLKRKQTQDYVSHIWIIAKVDLTAPKLISAALDDSDLHNENSNIVPNGV